MTAVSEMSNVQLLAYLKEIHAKDRAEEAGLIALQANERNRMPDIVSAGIRDMNKIIWPNTVSSDYLEVSPVKQFNERNIQISAEAAFVATKMVKSVFKKDGAGVYVWQNPEDINVLVNGIEVSTSDPQSSRNFNKLPVGIDNIGYAKYPTKMLARPLILPNSSINIKVYSKNPTETFYVNISFLGFRIRIEDAQDLLGLVTKY